MNYRILFIDEESNQQDYFKDYFEEIYKDFTPECMFPSATIEEMLNKINDYSPDAIIADFRLNEKRTDIKYNVSYNGVELIKAIREEREDFPCFVLTSHDDEAVNDTDDVNLIYVKAILTKDEAQVKFAERIVSQIDKYRAKINKSKKELMQLISKRISGIADVRDEERIIELDSFLERSLGAYNSIPTKLKNLSNLEKLTSLIDKVDEILKKIK